MCLTTNYKAEQCFGGSGGDYFSEAGTQQGRPLRGIGGASGDSLDNIVFHYSPYSQLDISTFKYKQSDLDQALATAPVKVYASDTRVSGPTPLTVTFNATHQLQHTETLQLTRALTSSTTQTATIGFTLSASTPGSEVSILGKTGLKKVLTEAAGGGGGNGANGSFSYSWTDSITNTSQQTVADQSQDSTGWTATFTLPGNMQGQLVTTWKQVSLDLRVTYDATPLLAVW